jgi:MOSC domain-containing protein YiiM
MNDEAGAAPLGTVVSVNVGEPRTVEWAGREVVTAIWKAPVAGRVPVAGVNLSGDRQADLRVHGGPDKAVYAYAIEDYRWWSSELDSEITVATFGENLTVEGADLDSAVVGDVWEVGTAALRVTQPRLPCFKLGIRMGDAAFVDRFDEAARYGVYLRIVREGDVGAGDAITRVSRPDHGLTSSAIAALHAFPDHDRLRQLIEIDDVPDTWREWALRQLGRAPR